jgi:hypothetical protein
MTMLDQQSATLSDYVFSDLFMSSDRTVPVLVRNLSGPGLQPVTNGATVELPAQLRADARALFGQMQAKWIELGKPNEFPLNVGDVAYRCSRIVAPDSVARIEMDGRDTTSEWCLRRLDARHLSLDSLGYPVWAREELFRIGARPGLLLVCGTFGSGKSTTAAALLQAWVIGHGGVAVTLEDPIEKPIAGLYQGGRVYQMNVPERGFADAVRASRRWAYRYLFIGETRGEMAARELLQIALGGPSVLTTIHASGPVEALMALSNFAAGPGMDPHAVNDRLAASIAGVIWQDLANGRLRVRYLSFRGRNVESMRTKVAEGRFRLLGDDLAFQTNLRDLGRYADSF